MLNYAALMAATGRKREANLMRRDAGRRARPDQNLDPNVIDIRDLLRGGTDGR
jgi:hypothetical protein